MGEIVTSFSLYVYTNLYIHIFTTFAHICSRYMFYKYTEDTYFYKFITRCNIQGILFVLPSFVLLLFPTWIKSCRENVGVPTSYDEHCDE